ncbi:translocation/assembly module TamB domain-containing protein [Paraburkholderia phosphatilytica]|uniref:translocation/assembly module TamB domain-containing protein n=1 Tax=Paraburkholderia phosphatilytica TaxID=2282883 RepID=UPI000E4D172F|nr:translocation/assembly module TamB domain-containing protein [Paraburkholderia phosphatilytica]
MTTETPDNPPPPPEAPPPDGGTPQGQQPPTPRRRRRVRRIWWAMLVPVVLILLAGGLVYGVVSTPQGTAYAWKAAVKLLGGRLTGTLDRGSIASGLKLHDVRWRSLDGRGTDVKVDRIDGRWALTDRPWRFTVSYLHIGTVDARIAPSPPSNTPTTLPDNLTVPMQVDLRDLRVDHLLLHDGATTSEYSDLLLHARTDGRHHEAAVERLDTPYGAVTASAKLDGVRPFPLTGDVGYAGKVNEEPVQVRGHLSGSLENLIAELDASGMKLNGHAHVEAAPFAPVPLQRATLSFDHVNPQAFAPGAPLADLAVRAELQPVTAEGVAADAAASGASTAASAGVASSAPRAFAASAASAPSKASTASAASAAATPKSSSSSNFAVTGAVSIVNAKPGAIDEHLLPLIDAHADVRLDASAQHISNLNVRLIRRATLTGGGQLEGRRGRFDLKVADLDLNALEASVRPTQLSGPIGVRLNDDSQSLTLDLADPKAGLRAQGKVTLDPARISFNDVRVSSGKGRIDLSGAIKHDTASTYNLKATLTDFDPLSLTTQKPAKAAAKAGTGKTAKGTTGETGSKPPGPTAKPVEARVNGTITATGVMAPEFRTKAEFKLGDSVYDNLPMTGSGTIQLAGSRLLPSRASLSVAGNDVDVQGSFGGRGDRLRFHVNAPALDHLGFGIAGVVTADGDLTGSFAHPNVVLDYKADSVAFGATKIGHAEGHAEARDGANGALVFTTDARNLESSGFSLATLTAHLNGTRANHTLEASATGSVRNHPINLNVAANGHLTDARDGTHWDGTVTRLANTGTPQLKLEAPLTISYAPEHVTLGATRMTIEGASLDLKSFALDHGRIRSAGSLTSVSLARLMAVREEVTGVPPPLKTDLVFDGDWDFSIGDTASGHIQLKRRGGDVTVEVGRGLAALGIQDIAFRTDFAPGNRVNATVHAQANRLGTIDVNAHTALSMQDGHLGLDEEAPLSGTINADIPSLATTGGIFGPSYLLEGHLALKLAINGSVSRPKVSGSLNGDDLSATLVDQGVQLKDGIVRIGLSENLVDFQQVEFHGASGTLRATGRVQLTGDQPDLSASIIADKLELFAAPDRQMSLSGSATVANAGREGGLEINGKFMVDHALFDMPEQSSPSLGDDVVVVRPDGTVRGEKKPGVTNSDKPVGPFAPRANVDINLGRSFRFRGQGADLGLGGTITLMSAPNYPLRAVGNVRVTEGSTYTAFGRKLNIENGFFTFNGPVANPGINILAMRRNQEVEAGVQVTGTVQAPVAKLVSEPNVSDNDKLSWLLFGHGTEQGNNLGQQSTMTTALALLGNAGGKRIAQTFGLDEFSVGTSDVGLTDPQVVMVSKAINEWLVLGYEQGLQSASNAIKATVNLTRYWSASVFGGTFQGLNVLYTRRFDRIRW